MYTGSDSQTYAVLGPDDERKGYRVLRVDGEAATVLAVASDNAAADRIVAEQLDGTSQARADRFFSWLDQKENSVRADVRGLLTIAGYRFCHTGGGCLGWSKSLDGDSHLLITFGSDEADGDPAQIDWSVGRYDGDGWINLAPSFTLAEAITVGEKLPPAIDAEGRPLQHVYKSLAEALASNTPPHNL